MLQFLGIVFLLGCCSATVQAAACEAEPDSAGCESFAAQPSLRRPSRVLLVPLLSKSKDSIESERWPEIPAASIADFYREAYQAQVVWLRDVRDWRDYYQQFDRLLRQSASFDRVIFIGHGGFDGPILNPAVFRRDFSVQAGTGKLLREIEAQPGISRSVTITYDVARNRAFSDYIAAHWRELLALDADPEQTLKAREADLQPLNQSCYQRCRSDAAAAVGTSQPAACEWLCREQLFVAKLSEEPAPERFQLFAERLRALVAADGLIMLGFCNSGSEANEGVDRWDSDGVLVHSALAGGPHESYVHLLASATGRTVVGPIGKSSGDDVVARIRLFENHQFQRYLRIVPPPVRSSGLAAAGDARRRLD